MWVELTRSVSVAKEIAQTEQRLRGGVISDSLVEFGAVMVAAARDHLAEAADSPDPRRRVEDAAAALQVAYRAEERAMNRGAPVWMRTATRRWSRQYREGLGRVAGNAAAVAVLRAHLGEPPVTVRKWLDRVARPVAAERTILQTVHDRTVHGAPITKVVGDPAVREHLTSYFDLEWLLLPAELVRPLPPAWRRTETGVVPRTMGEMHSDPELKEWMRQQLTAAEVEKHRELVDATSQLQGDPDSLILDAPVEQVVPVFDPEA